MAKLERGINDLETYCKNNDRQELLEEWDYSKNMGLTPKDICYGSGKKFWWIGKCGHSYYASLNRRTANKTGCPYCCESHAKLLTGFNDLETTNPEIVASWDYEKNGELLPSMVMKGQHKKVWWKGSCGHSWEATIYHRVQGRGCPICRKESKTSFPEQATFFYVKRAFPDAENGKKAVLAGKELDIFVPSLNVGIEFDGGNWHEDKAKDEQKDELCSKAKIHLYRIRDVSCPTLTPNPYVHIIDFASYTDESLQYVLRELANRLNTYFDVCLERDKIEIYNQFLVQKKENSFAELHPELVKEWNFDRNGELTPDLVVAKSTKKVWWKCEKGHEWQAAIFTRANGVGCPYCISNRLLKGYNDLATTRPDALKYWCYEKNSISPDEVSPNSTKRVWWHCERCGTDFLYQIKYKLSNLDRCPYCLSMQPKRKNDAPITKSLAHKPPRKSRKPNAKRQEVARKPIVKELSLSVRAPLIAAEWDFDKNGTLTPEDVGLFSGKKVWWKCKLGHSYQATVSNRNNRKGCPYCSGHGVLRGYNDFASKHPDLVSEWDYEKNDCLPTDLTEHSGKKVWWICHKGHSWQATVDNRSKGSGCPYCNGNHRRAVLNIDTNTRYASLREAAASCGLKQGDTISLCCAGKQKKAGGYHWKYVDEEIDAK